jgi:hypothetical protein
MDIDSNPTYTGITSLHAILNMSRAFFTAAGIAFIVVIFFLYFYVSACSRNSG